MEIYVSSFAVYLEGISFYTGRLVQYKVVGEIRLTCARMRPSKAM